MLRTERQDSVVRSPRAEHSVLFDRRNSVEQPYSPVVRQGGTDHSPPPSPSTAVKPLLQQRERERGATGTGLGGGLGALVPPPRNRPTLLQLLTLAIACAALYRSYRPSSSSDAPSPPSSSSASPPLSPLHNPHHLLGLSSVVVAPRALAPQYHSHPGACNSSSLLRAVSRARILPLPDGRSRKVDYAVPGDAHDLRSDGFGMSYDLEMEGCRAPHLYSADEACDLLRAYGGVMLRGDSFVRHVANALFILLSGRNDGAVMEEGERCRGNAMFDDRKAHCREKSVTNSQLMPQPVCGGDAHIFFELNSWGAQPAHLSHAAYDSWRWSLPPHKSTLSHVFISGFGLHHHLHSLTGIQGFVRPYLAKARQLFPRPVGLWFAIHAPAPGKPERWAQEQGAENVQRYNREVGGLLDALSPGEFVEETGTMKRVEWYNVTDGAESYDGSHYSYQVNMEKVVILLNLLDTIWGEAVAAGGLLETF